MAKQSTSTMEVRFEKIKELGEGGNAKVLFVRDKETGQECALKYLYNKSTEKKARFIDEIRIMKDNGSKIEGIIPIIDYSEEEYWYTMPVAKSVMEHIIQSKIKVEDIVQGIIELSSTLMKLHENGISHRDIKPSNIYFYKERFYLGDFGLVEFPDNPNDFTQSDKGLGAIFTIAPEMKRNPKNSDGKKADVFSLAKTLWMLLGRDELGFDGTYNILDKSHSLRFKSTFKRIHLVEIEELLSVSTDNNPDNRPSIDEFYQKLQYWVLISADFEKSQISDWKFINRYLFGDNPPESTVWRNADKIINVLNIIGTLPAYNHMLFSDNGGLDFGSAEIANESNCIYIYDSIGFCFIVKPKCLYYEGFEEKYEWNYFLLEIDKLEPVFEENGVTNYEYLVEDYPAHYVSARYEQYGVYDYDSGEPLPYGYKCVRRYLGGKFLIVLKNGPYNGIPATYDGRHGMCSNDEFRKYLNQLIDIVDQLKQKGFDEDAILSSEIFRKNPFKGLDNHERSEPRIKKGFKPLIATNISDWCFQEMLKNADEDSNIRFCFTFKIDGNTILSFLDDEKYYLCSDGYVRKMNRNDMGNRYYVYGRKELDNLLVGCNEVLRKKCKENGFDLPEYENFVSATLEKCGKPYHLFTKEEIEDVMRNADDRTHNMLVIDENGYAKLIQEINEGTRYPVSHESWDAGNNYVGKYSTLSTLDDDYISSLQGWLMYLKSGRHINMDYVHENTNVEELVKEIKEYY